MSPSERNAIQNLREARETLISQLNAFESGTHGTGGKRLGPETAGETQRAIAEIKKQIADLDDQLAEAGASP
jgi:hypothetical protein